MCTDSTNEVKKMDVISDHIRKNLDILFVGFNPSLRSGQVGYHYANVRNRFWTILFKAGLTTRKYAPEEDYKLLEVGYGLTNIVARPTKTADEITAEEYENGRIQLKRKIIYYRPKVVCFVGKGVYEQYSKKRNVTWGLQKSTVVKGVKEFVAPSSSGLVRMRLTEIVDIYRQLHSIVNE